MGVAELATRTMVQEQNTEDPYRILACAIIEQAVEDYRAALVSIKNRIVQDKKPLIQMLWKANEIEAFFESEWFMMLSPIEGVDIINILLHEHDYSDVIKWRETHDFNGNLIVDAEEHEDELCWLEVDA